MESSTRLGRLRSEARGGGGLTACGGPGVTVSRERLPPSHSIGVVFGREDHVEAGHDDGRGENEAEEYQD